MAEFKEMYCGGCAHADVCKNVSVVTGLQLNYGDFLSFICKYRETKKEEPKREVKPKPYKIKDIYEGMEVSKFGAD